MRLSLVQMLCEKGEIDRNLADTRAAIDRAAEREISIVVFPEMSITGYIDPSKWPDAVLDINSEAVTEFIAMTDGRVLTAVAGIVERNPDGKPFITQIVARRGQLIGAYRKMTVIEDEADWFSAGTDIPTFMHSDTRFGISICADIDNPTIFTTCAEQGAQLMLECAAPGYTVIRKHETGRVDSTGGERNAHTISVGTHDRTVSTSPSRLRLAEPLTKISPAVATCSGRTGISSRRRRIGRSVSWMSMCRFMFEGTS